MSLLIPALVLAAVIVVLVVVLGGAGGTSWVGRRTAQAEENADPATPTLDYLVPAGQDPVVLMTALSAEGYPATVDPHLTGLLHVSCPTGVDRERAHVRAIIAGVHTTAIDAGTPMEPGEVRFTDEA